MNYNANLGARQPGPVGPARKAKRVSDVNAIGPTVNQSGVFVPTPAYPQSGPIAPQQPQQQPQQVYGGPQTGQMPRPGNQFEMNPNLSYNPGGAPEFNQYGGFGGQMPQQQPQQQHQQPAGPNIPPQFAMFQQPIVQDMAMQYGQKLADQGKELVNKEFEKYVPVTRLKFYFAVDNKYVINKLRLLFFPFTHSDWSLKYDQDSPVQPRYDINAPDLYIPTMAYITYIVLAGFALALQDRFSPEQLGIQASSALAYSLIELVIYSVTLYIANITTTLKTLDLLAFSGYKYSIIVACIIISIIFEKTGYYIALIYCSISLALFLLRTLKVKVLHDQPQDTAPTIGYDAYGQPQPQQQQFDYSVGRKRKLYFLFLVAGFQPVLTFWLSMHLIPTSAKISA